MTTRIYLVAACIAGQAQAPRLIEAGTAAAARNHATRDMLTVKPATAKEVAALVKAGTALEIANEAPIEQQQLPGTGDDDGTTGGAGLGSTPELPDAEIPDAPAASGDTPAWPFPPPEASRSRRRRTEVV